MQQPDNTAFVRSLHQAFGRGDIQHILDNVTDDIDWIEEGPVSLPTSGKRKGRESVLEFFHTLASTLSDGKIVEEDAIAQGGKVVILGRFTARVKANGRQIDAPIAHIFTIRGGKVARFVAFSDTALLADAYNAVPLMQEAS